VYGKSKGEGRKKGKLECPVRPYFSVFSADLSPHRKKIKLELKKTF
jgi:hypothetical protein